MGKLLNLKAAPANKQKIIDEYGDVSAQRQAFQPTEKRYNQLRDEIKSWYETSDAEKEYVEKGARYQLDVTPCANVRTLDIRAVYKKLGIAKFLKACSVTLKALADYLSDDEIDALATTARTGARAYTVTPMATPAAQPPAVAASDRLLDGVQ